MGKGMLGLSVLTGLVGFVLSSATGWAAGGAGARVAGPVGGRVGVPGVPVAARVAGAPAVPGGHGGFGRGGFGGHHGGFPGNNCGAPLGSPDPSSISDKPLFPTGGNWLPTTTWGVPDPSFHNGSRFHNGGHGQNGNGFYGPLPPPYGTVGAPIEGLNNPPEFQGGIFTPVAPPIPGSPVVYGTPSDSTIQGFTPNPVQGFVPNPVQGFNPHPVTGFNPNPVQGFTRLPAGQVPNHSFGRPGFGPGVGFETGPAPRFQKNSLAVSSITPCKPECQLSEVDLSARVVEWAGIRIVRSGK